MDGASPFDGSSRTCGGAVERGGLSCHQAAARFGVGISTAIDWVARFRETGSVAPDQMGGHRPKKLIGACVTGCCSAAGSGTSPCAGWWPSWPNAG